jgi:hypothetical protein
MSAELADDVQSFLRRRTGAVALPPIAEQGEGDFVIEEEEEAREEEEEAPLPLDFPAPPEFLPPPPEDDEKDHGGSMVELDSVCSGACLLTACLIVFVFYILTRFPG